MEIVNFGSSAERPKQSVLNDYRLVALTSRVMGCFECIVNDILVSQTGNYMDALQFAYRAKRSVDDAIITLLHSIYSHLDQPRTYVRTLFLDFSSASNPM